MLRALALLTLIVSLPLWGGLPALSEEGLDLKTVRVDEMDGRLAVMGRLGRPLGTVLTVTADVIDGESLGAKGLSGVKLLKISSLGSTAVLAEPVFLQFAWYDGRDTFQLEGHVTLIGYETGAYAGLPAEAFAHIPRVASEDFHFETSFVVLANK